MVSTEELRANIKKRTLDQEFQRDKQVFSEALRLNNKTPGSQEEQSAFFLRTLLAATNLGKGSISSGKAKSGKLGAFSDPNKSSPASSEEKVINISDNDVPLINYLARGQRIAILIPPIETKEQQNDFFNKLTYGCKVQTRSAATHSVTINKSGDIKENKISAAIAGLKAVASTIKLAFGAINRSIANSAIFIGNIFRTNKKPYKRFDPATHEHYGIDLAIRNNEEGRTPKANGEFGHAYINYTAPTTRTPGVLLIGLEEGSPSSSKHSITGKAQPVSVTGGAKIEDIYEKIAKEKKDIIMPDKYNGIRIDLSQNVLKDFESIAVLDNITTLNEKTLLLTPKEARKSLLKLPQPYKKAPSSKKSLVPAATPTKLSALKKKRKMGY